MRKLVSICSGLALTFLLPSWAQAGTLIFFDTTDDPTGDVITLSDDTGRTTLFGCLNSIAFCSVRLLPPSGATFASVDGFGVPTETNKFTISFADPGTNFESDFLEIQPNLDSDFNIIPGLLITFDSDIDGQFPTECFDLQTGGHFCNGGFEDGTIQTAATVRWLSSLGATVALDTISFQSDVEAPEPSTVMLILTGLIGLATLSYHGWSAFRPRVN